MYERFFGLADAPFRLTPDPRYLFLSPKHAEALAGAALARRHRRGAGPLARRPGATPSPLEPRDDDREAAPYRAGRPAAAPRAPPPPRAGAAEPAHHAALAHGAALPPRDGRLRAPPPARRE